MTLDDALALLRRRRQQGLFAEALTICDAVLAAAPGHAEATLHRDRLLRPPPPVPRPQTPTLVWRVDETARDWSRDWVMRLLDGAAAVEIVDEKGDVFPDRALIVDQKLTAADLERYRRAHNAGRRFGLLHLSDESYADDRAVYDYCDFVLRNYWSDLLADDRRVTALPLGYKSGVDDAHADRPAADRPLLWSFAGDPNKATRPAMLAALDGLGPHRVHLTRSFFDPAGLDAAAYRALLEDAVFAPCPGGFINLDSFRVYEALQCGCIPVVERRPGFDYFARLLGEHPLIVVDDWRTGGAEIARLAADPTELEPRRRLCRDWWRGKVGELRTTVRRALDGL